jgi:hypothetical protein
MLIHNKPINMHISIVIKPYELRRHTCRQPVLSTLLFLPPKIYLKLTDLEKAVIYVFMASLFIYPNMFFDCPDLCAWPGWCRIQSVLRCEHTKGWISNLSQMTRRLWTLWWLVEGSRSLPWVPYRHNDLTSQKEVKGKTYENIRLVSNPDAFCTESQWFIRKRLWYKQKFSSIYMFLIRCYYVCNDYYVMFGMQSFLQVSEI